MFITTLPVKRKLNITLEYARENSKSKIAKLKGGLILSVDLFLILSAIIEK